MSTYAVNITRRALDDMNDTQKPSDQSAGGRFFYLLLR